MTRTYKVLAALVLVPVVTLGSCVLLLPWSMGEHGRTALHDAADNNDVATIREWIARGKDVDREMQFASNIEHSGDKGVTPLMLAAKAGHEEAALLLLEAGARADARTHSPSFPESGESVLEYSIEGGNPATVRAVLTKVAAGLSRADRQAALAIAIGSICEGAYYTVPGDTTRDDRRLQVARAVIEQVPLSEERVLTSRLVDPACSQLIELGLDRGVEPTPEMLIVAARMGDQEVLRRLLAKGVDVNSRVPLGDEPGQATALMTAWKWQRAAVFDQLLEAGANPDTPGPDGATLLHLLLAKPNRESVDLVNRLIARGARTDIPDRSGQTAAQMGSRFTPRVDRGFSPQARKALQIPDPIQQVEIIGGRTVRGVCQNCPIEPPPPATK